MSGQVLGERYRVGHVIGEGGMGTVYAAEHIAIQKKLAIKVLAEEFAGQRVYRRRFIREARAVSKIDHPNVIRVSDFGVTPQGSLFLVTELLRGEPLAATIAREGALPWSRARPMLLQIARGIAAAHQQHILHRDIKPENCFRIHLEGNEDFIKVLDFGLAKILGTEHSVESSLTASGRVIGTAEYIAPEQIRGEQVDARTDIYSFGVVMYELLTGCVPFSGMNYALVLEQHLSADPIPPSHVAPKAGIPPLLDELVLQALAKDPVERFGSMQAVSTALEAIPVASAPVAKPLQTEPRRFKTVPAPRMTEVVAQPSPRQTAPPPSFQLPQSTGAPALLASPASSAPTGVRIYQRLVVLLAFLVIALMGVVVWLLWGP